MKHSPGPWAIERNLKAGNVVHLAITARQNGSDWMVCSITPEAWARPIDLANANLITAAPELLEALEAVVAAMLNHAGWSTNHTADGKERPMTRPNDVATAETKARAAIAKAKGIK